MHFSHKMLTSGGTHFSYLPENGPVEFGPTWLVAMPL